MKLTQGGGDGRARNDLLWNAPARRSLQLHWEKVIFIENVFFFWLVSSPPRCTKKGERRTQQERHWTSEQAASKLCSDTSNIARTERKVLLNAPSENVETLSFIVQKVWRRRCNQDGRSMQPWTGYTDIWKNARRWQTTAGSRQLRIAPGGNWTPPYSPWGLVTDGSGDRKEKSWL